MKKYFVVLLSLFVVNTAFAAFVFNPSFSYMTSEIEATQPAVSSSKSTETRMDFKIGYVLPMGLYLGGMYSSLSLGNGSTTNKGSSMGPSIGYFSPMGFYTLLTYFIVGDIEQSPAKYTGAKGPQIDVGWVFPISSYFSIGPQMTWRSVTFDKIETAGLTVDTDTKLTSIAPYLSLWFMF